MLGRMQSELSMPGNARLFSQRHGGKDGFGVQDLAGTNASPGTQRVESAPNVGHEGSGGSAIRSSSAARYFKVDEPPPEQKPNKDVTQSRPGVVPISVSGTSKTNPGNSTQVVKPINPALPIASKSLEVVGRPAISTSGTPESPVALPVVSPKPGAGSSRASTNNTGVGNIASARNPANRLPGSRGSPSTLGEDPRFDPSSPRLRALLQGCFQCPRRFCLPRRTPQSGRCKVPHQRRRCHQNPRFGFIGIAASKDRSRKVRGVAPVPKPDIERHCFARGRFGITIGVVCRFPFFVAINRINAGQ